jgi:hypothetical protein
MQKILSGVLATSALFAAVPACAATFVVDANSSGTSLGTFVAGQEYKFTVTGVVDLVGDPVPGGRFNLDANGIPQPAVTYPGYAYFNFGGSPVADGQSGPMVGTNFGALIGNFGGASPYFLIGSSLTTSFLQSGEIFARINDINANNNGSFAVTVTAVPEAATWTMLLLGFGVMGGALRRRARPTVRVAFA